MYDSLYWNYTRVWLISSFRFMESLREGVRSGSCTKGTLGNLLGSIGESQVTYPPYRAGI